jgi:PAS domain S-box-containing protein
MPQSQRDDRSGAHAELFRLLVEKTEGYAVFHVDIQGRTEDWNVGVRRLLGYDESEFLGQGLKLIFTPEDVRPGVPEDEIRKALASGQASADRWYVRKDGSRFWATGTLVRLSGGDGRIRGFAKILRDRSESKIRAIAAEERARLDAFNADVGLALIKSDTLQEMLHHCTDSMVRHLDGAFARIWTLNTAENILELRASSGLYTHLDGPHSRVPVGRFKIGLIAQERQPHLTNSVVGDPRVNQQEWARQEGMVAFAGYPLIVDDRVIGVMAMFARHPLTDASLEAMASVANGIAVGIERKIAEEDRRTQQEWLAVTLASIGDAVIATDIVGQVRFLNGVAQDLTGWSQTDAEGQPLEKVFAIENEKTRQPIENPVARVFKEGRIVGLANHTVLVSRDGTVRPIADSAAPIRSIDGRIIGAVLVFRDVTKQRRAETEIRKSEEKLRLLADTIPQLAWMAKPDGHILWYNRRWYDYTGTTPEIMESWNWQSIHDPELLPKIQERWNASLATGQPFEMVFPLKGADGLFKTFLTRVNPLKDELGQTLYWFGTNTDISEQQRAADSSRFLSEASAVLAAVVDYRSTLGNIARLAVPYFADWCSIDMAANDGMLERLAVAHIDPAKVALAEELHRRFPPRRDAPRGAYHVLRTGQPEMLAEVTDELLTASVRDAEQLRIIRELRLRSYIAVPLVVRSKTLGVITFVSSKSERRYGPEDLKLAQDLANRASIAIDNSLLYQQLHDADRRKDEFLATLAHELRNPLAPIRNSLQILKMNRSIAETGQQLTEMMERQVQQLVRLVDDLLDVSRIMRGKIDLRKERVELAAVVERAVEMVQPLIESHGHELTIDLPSESLPINADPVRMTQVVGNLLNNAVKYTEPHGHIRLTAGLDHDNVVLRIRDDGIGIAPDMLPHIFELFVQVDHTATRSQGGLGIGLTLVRNLIEMHQGAIEAHSEGLGKGCEFVVRLPVAVAAKPCPIDDEIGAGGNLKPLTGRRLLVVDDNRDAAISLAILLRMKGHEVQLAHDGPSALELAKIYRPDMVFLDIGMPGMDGYEVARHMRQMQGLENSVLAALTGWGQQEDRRRSAEAGFDRHLVKPPEPQALDELLADLDQRMNSAAKSASDAGSKGLRILIVEDNAVAAKILSMLIGKLGPHEVAIEHDGPAAIEKAKDFRPEMILTDIGLPTMDGYQLAQRLRQTDVCADALLVALTGYGEDEDRRKAREAGFDEHFVKPVDIDDLKQLLSHPKL